MGVSPQEGKREARSSPVKQRGRSGNGRDQATLGAGIDGGLGERGGGVCREVSDHSGGLEL